jgi:hypothetical protein
MSEHKQAYSIRELVFESIGALDTRLPARREHIFVSEIGGAFIDTYLAMRGVAPEVKKDPRGLFSVAVSHSVEDKVINSLIQSGIASIPDPMVLKTSDLLDVHGERSVIVEVSDWDEQKTKLDPSQADGVREMLSNLQELRPIGLRKTVVTVKAKNDNAYLYSVGKRKDQNGNLVSIVGYNPKEKNRESLMQLLSYMKFHQCLNGAILLVNKNAGMSAKNDNKSLSARFYDMAQLDLNLGDSYTNQEWSNWMQEMTYYHRSNVIPPIPDEQWRVDYSDYRELIVRGRTNLDVIQKAIDNSK